jgi:hypothetical protein
MARSDDIGERGEGLFRVLITRFAEGEEPLSRPRFLGEKAQALDFLVEVATTLPPTAFFFVQVRTTGRGLTKANRLKVSLEETECQRILDYPAPTYLIGIDARAAEERGYIISINDGPARRVASMSTRFPLNNDNLKLLRDEIVDFWSSKDMKVRASRFRERG